MDPITIDFQSVAIQALAPIIVGGAITWIVHWAKKNGWAARPVIVSCAVVIAIGVTAFNTFVPADLRANVLNFLSLSIATTWTIYEFVIRFFKDGEIPLKTTPPPDSGDGQ